MSFQEVEKLSKAELKNRLTQMGMSLDRNDHPRDYYVQLYLEKANSKNKITRDNTPFYKKKMLRGKRERERGKLKDKELIEDPNYEEEEYEEEEEYNDVDDSDEDEDYIYEEEEEEINDNVEKEKSKTKRKKRMKKKVEERYNDYRESGIKITKLIRIKKERIPKNKKIILENSNQKINVESGIKNNYTEMAGQNEDYNNNNKEIDINDKYTLNRNMNQGENYEYKNNEFHQYHNNNIPDNKNGVINIQVENLSSYKDNNNNDNENLNNRQELRNEENETNQINYSFRASEEDQNNFKEISKKSNIIFGAPKNDKETNYHLLSNGPISFGYNQNSTLSKLKDKENNDDDYLERNSGNKSQNYNYFLTNLTNSVKDDIKQNEKSSHPKKVLLKWDTTKQKEFLYSSMPKEPSLRPSDENMNNMEEVKPKYSFNVNPNLQENDKPPKNQNISESIQNTTINQYDNKKIGNDGQNGYKFKLKSYNRNKGEQINNINNEKTFTNQGYDNLNNTNNNYSNAKDNDIINESNNEVYNKNNDIGLNNYGKGSNNINININMNNDENLDKLNNNKNINNYLNINENSNINYNYRNNNPINENIQMKGSHNINYSSNDLNHDHGNNNLNMINQNNMNTNEKMYQNNNMLNQISKNSLNVNENTTNNNNEIAEDMIEYEENNNILNKTSNNQLKSNRNFNNMNINNDNNNEMVEDMIEYEKNNNILNKSSHNQLNNKDNFNSMIINNDNNINQNTYNNNTMNSNNNNMINEKLMNNNDIGLNKNYNNNYSSNSFGQNNNVDNINGENESQYSTLTHYTFGIGKYARNLKKNIMEKFKNNIYLWPIIIMIVFGIAYLLNEKYEHCERTNIILSFSIIMALIIIYNLYKYYKDLKNFKKMAREDRLYLLERLHNEQINNENLDNNELLLNNFIDSRVLYHHVTLDEYSNYVFPYLREYLEKDGLFLIKNNNENENNVIIYWKEI